GSGGGGGKGKGGGGREAGRARGPCEYADAAGAVGRRDAASRRPGHQTRAEDGKRIAQRSCGRVRRRCAASPSHTGRSGESCGSEENADFGFRQPQAATSL